MGGFWGDAVDSVARAGMAHNIPIVSGVDDIVAASLPAGFAPPLIDGEEFIFESVGANSGATTLDVGTGVAYPLTHIGGAALIAGDIPTLSTLIRANFDAVNNTFHATLIRQPSSAVPAENGGAGAAGISTRYSKGDHSHPVPTGQLNFTDLSGAGLTFAAEQSNRYTKIGKTIFARGRLVFPVNASALPVSLGGLPYPIALLGGSSDLIGDAVSRTALITDMLMRNDSPNQNIVLYNNSSGAQIINSDLSGATIHYLMQYETP